MDTAKCNKFTSRIAQRIRQLVEATCDIGDVAGLFRLADANGP